MRIGRPVRLHFNQAPECHLLSLPLLAAHELTDSAQSRLVAGWAARAGRQTSCRLKSSHSQGKTEAPESARKPSSCKMEPPMENIHTTRTQLQLAHPRDWLLVHPRLKGPRMLRFCSALLLAAPPLSPSPNQLLLSPCASLSLSLCSLALHLQAS